MSFNLQSVLSFFESDMGDSHTFSGTSVSGGCLLELSQYVDRQTLSQYEEGAAHFNLHFAKIGNFHRKDLEKVVLKLQRMWTSLLEEEMAGVSCADKEKTISRVVDFAADFFKEGRAIDDSLEEAKSKILKETKLSDGRHRLMNRSQGALKRRKERRAREAETQLIKKLIAERERVYLLVQVARKSGLPIAEVDQEAIKKYRLEMAQEAERSLLAELEREEVKTVAKKATKKKKGRKRPPLSKKVASAPSKVENHIELPNSISPAVNPAFRALYNPVRKWKYHCRVKRWQGADELRVRTFQDEPGPGQKSYSEMDPDECARAIAVHELMGVERFFEASLIERYSYPYTYVNQQSGQIQMGRGLYAEMTVPDGKVQSGVITVGIGKRLIYHMHFRAFRNQIIIGRDLAEPLPKPDTDGPSREWTYVNACHFEEEANGVVKMVCNTKRESLVFFRIYPLV